MSEQLRQLLEVREAQGRLRIGKTKFYELLRSGQLRSVKIGDRRLIPAEALNEYVDGLASRDSGGNAA